MSMLMSINPAPGADGDSPARHIPAAVDQVLEAQTELAVLMVGLACRRMSDAQQRWVQALADGRCRDEDGHRPAFSCLNFLFSLSGNPMAREMWREGERALRALGVTLDDAAQALENAEALEALVQALQARDDAATELPTRELFATARVRLQSRWTPAARH